MSDIEIQTKACIDCNGNGCALCEGSGSQPVFCEQCGNAIALKASDVDDLDDDFYCTCEHCPVCFHPLTSNGVCIECTGKAAAE